MSSVVVSSGVTPSGPVPSLLSPNFLAAPTLQVTFAIDPVNGNDMNPGTILFDASGNVLSSAPVQTCSRLREIVGQPWFVSAAQIDIWILNTIPATDPFYLDVYPLVPTRVFLHGVITRTYTGGTMSAITALNRATNTRQTFTDANIPAGAATTNLVKVTSSATPKFAILSANLGAGQWRTSRFLQFDAQSTSIAPTMVDPAVNDRFDLYSVPTITAGVIQVRDCVVTDANAVTIQCENLQIGGPSSGTASVIFCGGEGTRHMILNNCLLGRSTFLGGVVIAQNCCLVGNTKSRSGCNFCMWGGLGFSGSNALLAEGAQVEFDYDTMFEGGGLNLAEYWEGNSCYIGAMAFFRTSGNGLNINPGQTVFNTVDSSGIQAIWGTQAAGGSFGINVRSRGALVYNGAKPTVTGVANDTSIGGVATAYAAIPAITAANGAGIVAYA